MTSQTTLNPAIQTTTPPPNPVSRETEFTHRAAWKASVLGSLNVLFVVLAVRMILLVAVIGAIWLTVAVERDPDQWRLAALAVYALIVVAPLVWLTSRQGR